MKNHYTVYNFKHFKSDIECYIFNIDSYPTYLRFVESFNQLNNSTNKQSVIFYTLTSNIIKQLNKAILLSD